MIPEGNPKHVRRASGMRIVSAAACMYITGSPRGLRDGLAGVGRAYCKLTQESKCKTGVVRLTTVLFSPSACYQPLKHFNAFTAESRKHRLSSITGAELAMVSFGGPFIAVVILQIVGPRPP